MAWTRMVARSGGILIAASLVIGGAAAPVSASGTTRWVDDDGAAGPTSCDGSGSASTTIQSAVSASGANDTVKVCPGTYTELVTISGSRDGLTLESVTSHAAIIRAAATSTLTTTILVKISDVDHVTVSGFSIRPRRANSSSACDWSTGIKASGSLDLSITGNQVTPTGSGPFCGVSDGIALSAGSTGTISNDFVKDYREQGIHLSGVGTDVTVEDSTVTFAQVGLDPSGGAAILVESGAKGHIHDNVVHGPAAGSGVGQPAAGVQFDHSAAGSTVIGNTITRMAADIDMVNASGGIIRQNVMTGGQVGLDLGNADDMSIHDNTSSAATVAGLAVQSTSRGNNVHDNDFRTNSNGSMLKDCTGQSGTGTHNTWTNNLGNSSKPAVLCAGPPPH